MTLLELEQLKEHLIARHNTILEAIEGVCHGLRAVPDTTAPMQVNFVQKSVIIRETSPKAVKAPAARRRSARRSKAVDDVTPRKPRKGARMLLTDAMRMVIPSMVAGFTRAKLTDEIVKRYPEAIQGKEHAIAVNLIDMTARGEVHRTGSGASAIYSVGKVKKARGAMTETEASYRAFRETIPTPSHE